MSCEYCKNGQDFGYFNIHKGIVGYELHGYDYFGDTTCEDIDYCPKCGCLLDNRPLTLDELKEMDGEPVWIVDKTDSTVTGWYIIQRANTSNIDGDCIDLNNDRYILYEDINTYVFVYRQKIEE